MTAPSVSVELGFGSTWQTEPASITWTDVTEFVLQGHRISTQRGASSARGQVDVGSLSLSLRNEDRRFDPLHAAGPYFDDLKPGVPVRINAVESLVWDGEVLEWDGESLVWGTFPVWYGSVAKWPQRYDLGNTFAWVPIEAWDGFDKLSRAKIPRSPIESAIVVDAPFAYWPLDETSGQMMVDRSGYTLDGEYTVGTTDLAGSIGTTPAIIFDGEHSGFSSTPAPNTGIQVAIEALIDLGQADDLTTGDRLCIAELVGPSGSHWFGLEVMDAATRTVRMVEYGGAPNLDWSAEFTAARPRHVAVRSTSSGFLGTPVRDYWLDGVEWAGSAFDASPPAYTGVATGRRIGGSKANGMFVGGLAHVAVFPSTLTSARIAAHAAAALAPLDDQRTDERAAWILDELDWPANLRDLEAGSVTLGPATFKPGDKALDYFRFLEQTEDGLVFVGPDGMFRFLDLYWRYLNTLATTSQFTFTDQDADQGYAEFQLDLDDELLVNIARFTRRDGTEQVATDATSVATYGEAELQRTNLLHRTDAQTRSLAEWTVATRSTPLPRIPKIRVPLHRYSSADQQTVLGLDLSHRVTVNRTPQGVGSAISQDFLIDGISNDVGEGEWWWTAVVSPVPQDTKDLFLWDSSLLDGADILAP